MDSTRGRRRRGAGGGGDRRDRPRTGRRPRVPGGGAGRGRRRRGVRRRARRARLAAVGGHRGVGAVGQQHVRRPPDRAGPAAPRGRPVRGRHGRRRPPPHARRRALGPAAPDVHALGARRRGDLGARLGRTRRHADPERGRLRAARPLRVRPVRDVLRRAAGVRDRAPALDPARHARRARRVPRADVAVRGRRPARARVPRLHQRPGGRHPLRPRPRAVRGGRRQRHGPLHVRDRGRRRPFPLGGPARPLHVLGGHRGVHGRPPADAHALDLAVFRRRGRPGVPRGPAPARLADPGRARRRNCRDGRARGAPRAQPARRRALHRAEFGLGAQEHEPRRGRDDRGEANRRLRLADVPDAERAVLP